MRTGENEQKNRGETGCQSIFPAFFCSLFSAPLTQSSRLLPLSECLEQASVLAFPSVCIDSYACACTCVATDISFVFSCDARYAAR